MQCRLCRVMNVHNNPSVDHIRHRLLSGSSQVNQRQNRKNIHLKLAITRDYGIQVQRLASIANHYFRDEELGCIYLHIRARQGDNVIFTSYLEGGDVGIKYDALALSPRLFLVSNLPPRLHSLSLPYHLGCPTCLNHNLTTFSSKISHAWLA